MKKIIIFLLSLIINIPMLSYALEKENNSDNLANGAKSAILIEASSGKILYKKNINEKYAPASMTKMMSLLLIMELIDNDKISLNDEVTASQNASSMGGSQIFLEPNEKMKVSDLIKGVAIASANDAITALAEYAYGSTEEFVKKMNEKATELGLKNTNFKNVHGLDEANHYSSAYDMSIIASQLVKHDLILSFSSIYEDYLRKGTDKQVWLVNTNKLVKYYKGADGLKTGYTKEAGYCLTSTAKRNGMRLISVVMGEDSSKNRNNDTSQLLDYGFNNYELETLISKNKKLDKIKISKGDKEQINVKLENDVSVLNKKSEDKKISNYEIIIDKIKLPLKKGDIVGKVKLNIDGEKTRYINILSNDDVNKINLFKLYFKNIKRIFTGIV